MSAKLTIKKLAKLSGVEVYRETGYRGPYAYRLKSSPSVSYIGLKSQAAAYAHWAEEKFGKPVVDALKTAGIE